MYAYFIFVQFSQNQTLHLPIFNAFLRCQKQILRGIAGHLVVLLYTLTFRILHFEVLTFLNVKNFLIGFLDELGNCKQKIFYISKYNILQRWCKNEKNHCVLFYQHCYM